MSRVLITGVAGLIGSSLADRLVADGHEVHGIDNFLTGREQNVNADVVLWEGDIANPFDLEAAFESLPDVVVHAAASYNDPRLVDRDALTNAFGTAAVVRCCHAYDVKRLVYFQTSLCYGINPPPHPMLTTHPLDPRGSYAVTKTAGEQIIRDSGIDYVSFRLANIYGPRNLSGPVPTFYKRLKAGDPCTVADTRRDFVYIDDAVDVFAKAVYGGGRSGVYHVSTGNDWPVASVFDSVCTCLYGFEPGPRDVEFVPRGPDDTWTLLLDPTRTVEEFDWSASTPLGDGIRSAVNWYEQNPPEQTYTHLRVREAA